MRPRLLTSTLLILTIATGLASRRFPLFPDVLQKYPGDALWAQMVYWLIAFCAPAASMLKVALLSLTVSYADELSQLYQAPWLVRSVPPPWATWFWARTFRGWTCCPIPSV